MSPPSPQLWAGDEGRARALTVGLTLGDAVGALVGDALGDSVGLPVGSLAWARRPATSAGAELV